MPGLFDGAKVGFVPERGCSQLERSISGAEPLKVDGAGTKAEVPMDLLSAVARHGADRPAFTDGRTRRSLTFGGLRDAALRAAVRLHQLRMQPGDAVAFFADGGFDPMPVLLACSRSGVRLVVSDAALPRSAAMAVVEQCRPKALVVPAGRHEGWGLEKGECHLFTHGEWLRDDGFAAEAKEARWAGRPGAADEPCLVVHTAGTTAPPKPVLLTPAGLLEMARAFREAYPVTAEDTFLAASPLSTASGIGIAGVIPMLTGAHVVLADQRDLEEPEAYWAAVARARATICELPAWRVPPLLHDATPVRIVPRRLRFVLCSGVGLPDAQRRAAEALWDRRVHQGYGTAETGYWAASSPHGPDGTCPSAGLKPSSGVDILIRPLRTPPTPPPNANVSGGTDAAPGEAGPAVGEILVRGAAVTPGYCRKSALTHVAFEGSYFRTGDVGSLDRDGNLAVLGRCKDLVVRGEAGVLLSDVDAVLGRHPALIESKTICDGTAGSDSRITSVCVAAAPVPDLRGWLAERVGAPWLPDRIVFAPALPRGPGGEVSTDLLRSIVGGRLQDEIVGALTARKFRRNPLHKEGALRELVQGAVLGHGPLRFLMFWGCGRRRDAAEPDSAALAALGELLDAARPAAWMRAQVDIILTDVHATANGHSEDHCASYFGQVERAAEGLDASFTLESRVWAPHGLTVEEVRRFAGTAELDQAWRDFPLRERFVEQASRHSRAADHEAAAKHYFATCKLERRVLAAAYPRSIFLTYNGPEFNECFPDLPTLYVYPGPRGRTVKPWFV